jgi:hypothetical protein
VANRVGQHVESGSFQENLDTFKACFLTSYHRQKRYTHDTHDTTHDTTRHDTRTE